METEEQYPSLYTALYNATTDHTRIGDLLRHPEFQRRARLICSRIAGSKGGEDLLQEVCLRVLESADDLNPDSIRSEGDFFEWFTRLARAVRLSKLLSAAAVNACADVAGRWPDSSDDVSDDYMERFLAHADDCPYHTRILRTEEEEVGSAFGRARGLDSGGRILLGEELKMKIADHERRLEHWRKVALRDGELHGQVALFNAGRKVASCGWFSDFSNHQSKHELDPHVGLQIRGVSSGDPDEDVLLGFYPLAGVRHGEDEKFLKLENGYTICLKVKEVGGNYFEIHFRCVDTKTLEPKTPEALPLLAGGGAVVIRDGAAEASGGGTPGKLARSPEPRATPAMPLPPPPAGWWHRLSTSRLAAASAVLLLAGPPCFLLGRAWGRMNETGATLAPVEARVGAPGAGPAGAGSLQPQVIMTEAKDLSRVGPEQFAGESSQRRSSVGAGLRRDAGASSPAHRSGHEQTRRAKGQPEGPPTYKGVPTSTAEIQDFLRRLPPGSAPQTVADGTTESSNEVNYRRSTTPTLLKTKEDHGLSGLDSVVRVSTNGRKSSADYSVFHVAKDELLGGKLYNALRDESLHVEPVSEQKQKQEQKAARFTVTWEMHSISTGDIKGVVLYVKISKEGEKKSLEWPSYTGVGHSLDAAYSDALEQAVKPIVEWLRSKNGARMSASADVPSEGQPVAALPKANAPEVERGDAGINADLVEPNTPQHVKCARGFE